MGVRGGGSGVWGTEGTWGVFSAPRAPPPAGAPPLGWTLKLRWEFAVALWGGSWGTL